MKTKPTLLPKLPLQVDRDAARETLDREYGAIIKRSAAPQPGDGARLLVLCSILKIDDDTCSSHITSSRWQQKE
jgi:hypothetical protein